MATEIRVPTLGESITEATVGKWFKKAGDAIKADEPLVELETDKVTLEVNAPASGVLSEIAVPTGETVAVGALLGMVAASSAASASKPAGAPAAASAAVAPKDVNGVAPKDVNGVAPKAPAPAATTMPPAPSAAKIAAEQGVDLGAVAGSGKRGQVLKGGAALASRGARLNSRRRGARRTRAPDQTAPDHRPPPEGGAEQRRHADDLQRGRHERGDGAAR
jgi:2-oxoglutarate dehydrogenase E2 component (dihydrolipoamide succinyltransferase)